MHTLAPRVFLVVCVLCVFVLCLFVFIVFRFSSSCFSLASFSSRRAGRLARMQTTTNKKHLASFFGRCGVGSAASARYGTRGAHAAVGKQNTSWLQRIYIFLYIYIYIFMYKCVSLYVSLYIYIPVRARATVENVELPPRQLELTRQLNDLLPPPLG